MFVASGLLAAASAGATSYPLHASANGRFMLDQNQVPYLITGDAPQALTVNVTEADAEMYFANRSAHGFNTLWVNLLCATYTGGRADGSTFDGILPFTGTIPSTSSYDLETPNEAFFAHVDRLIALAARYDLQILLDPLETGSWLTTALDNGTTKCRNYGRYLGNRYRSFDNIVWMSGNDFQGWRDEANDAVVRAVAMGIRDNDTRHLHTTELDYLVSSSLDDTTWSSILGLNATYTYFPTYARLQQDYLRPKFLPTFMVEANYEFESLQGPLTTAPILRKQEYWTMTSGAAGQLYGNGYVWPFVAGWQSHLDTPGAFQIGILKSFFEARAWYNLVPDTSHAVVIAGYGSFSSSGYVADNDYLTAARTSDGHLVVAYTPIVRTFTVDMTKLSAAAYTRWFDPSDGSYLSVAGSPLPNTGTRSFAPPGANHDGDGGWVLVLETQPPETVAPVVMVTSPGAGATVSDSIAVTATASDNVGVVGVRFDVDGASLGPEEMSAPYTVPWNTRNFGNGPHVVRATARDLAGNHAEASVTVTVNNPTPPPPTDHLAAAYAFDESNGTATADSSEHGNTGILHGATFVAGKHGNAVSFDGQADYVEVSNSASLDIGGSGLTIAFWARIQSTNSGVDYVIVGKPWSGSSMPSPFYQYGVEYSNSGNKTVDLFFGDPSGGLHGPYRMSAPPGVWTHVAYTYDGNTVHGYLDGVERLSTADPATLVARGNSLRLGVDGAYQQFYDGALDDLRLYSRALTAAEIRSVMETPVGSAPTVGAPIGSGELRLALSAAVPNPFHGKTRVTFTLPTRLDVELRVFDALGRIVRTLARGAFDPGTHEIEWNGLDEAGDAAAPGRYFVRLSAGRLEKTIDLVRLR